MEHLKNLTREQMQARLDEISPLLEHLTEAYRTGINVLTITLLIGTPTSHKAVAIPFLGADKVPAVLKQFIHDYSTLLCAEKLLLETYIEHGIR